MENKKIIKYAMYGTLVGIGISLSIDMVEPGLLPSDVSDSNTSLSIINVSGSSGSVVGMASYIPNTQQISTNKLDNHGNSYYKNII